MKNDRKYLTNNNGEIIEIMNKEKYVILWGYLKKINQVQCIKSYNIAFGTLGAHKGVG